jgi:hypothetical protein
MEPAMNQSSGASEPGLNAAAFSAGLPACSPAARDQTSTGSAAGQLIRLHPALVIRVICSTFVRGHVGLPPLPSNADCPKLRESGVRGRGHAAPVHYRPTQPQERCDVARPAGCDERFTGPWAGRT